MAINRFFKSSPSQFVFPEQPLEPLMAGLQARQQRFDTGSTLFDDLSTRGADLMETDMPGGGALLTDWQKRMDNLAEEYDGDYSAMVPQLKQIEREVNRAFSPQGVLGVAQSNKLMYQKNIEDLRTAYQNEKISSEDFLKAQDIARQRYADTGGVGFDQGTYGGNYNLYEPYSIPQVVSELDVATTIGGAMQPYGTDVTWDEKKGRYIFTRREAAQEITVERAQDAIMNALGNDPRYMERLAWDLGMSGVDINSPAIQQELQRRANSYAKMLAYKQTAESNTREEDRWDMLRAKLAADAAAQEPLADPATALTSYSGPVMKNAGGNSVKLGNTIDWWGSIKNLSIFDRKDAGQYLSNHISEGKIPAGIAPLVVEEYNRLLEANPNANAKDLANALEENVIHPMSQVERTFPQIPGSFWQNNMKPHWDNQWPRMDFFEIKKDGSTRSDAVNKSTQRTWTEVLPAGIVSTGDKIGLHVMAKNKNGDIIGEYVATNYNDALLDNFKPVLNLQNPVINGTRGTYTVTSIPREVLNTKTGKVEVKNMRQVFISDAKIGWDSSINKERPMVHLRSIEVPEENFNDFMRAVNANGNVAYDQNGTATYTDPLERDVIKQYVNNYEVIDPRTRMPRAIEWQDYGDRSTQIVNDLTMLTTARYMHNSELGEDFYTLGDSGYDMDNYFGAAALFYNLFNQ